MKNGRLHLGAALLVVVLVGAVATIALELLRPPVHGVFSERLHEVTRESLVAKSDRERFWALRSLRMRMFLSDKEIEAVCAYARADLGAEGERHQFREAVRRHWDRVGAALINEALRDLSDETAEPHWVIRLLDDLSWDSAAYSEPLSALREGDRVKCIQLLTELTPGTVSSTTTPGG